jgi:adenylate kinase
MRLILIGPPGSGKGTQAKLLSERLGLAHIATGDIFREAVRRGTPAGKMAEPFVVTGKLVPDDLVNELVAERFCRPDHPERFVMDGYPRTLPQANSFDQTLRQHSLNVQAVILLDVEDEEIVRRLSGRWSCPNPACKATFHATMNPPRKPGFCDNCQSKLIQRDDDKEETVRRRLSVYHKNTAEVIGHYRAQGLLQEVAGKGAIESIYSQIIQAIQRAVPSC